MATHRFNFKRPFLEVIVNVYDWNDPLALVQMDKVEFWVSVRGPRSRPPFQPYGYHTEYVGDDAELALAAVRKWFPQAHFPRKLFQYVRKAR